MRVCVLHFLVFILHRSGVREKQIAVKMTVTALNVESVEMKKWNAFMADSLPEKSVQD